MHWNLHRQRLSFTCVLYKPLLKWYQISLHISFSNISGKLWGNKTSPKTTPPIPLKNMFSGSQMWFCVSMQIMFWRKTKGFFWGGKGCIQVLLHKKWPRKCENVVSNVALRALGQNKSNVGVFSKAVFELFKLLPVPVFVYSTVNCIHRQWFLEMFLSLCRYFHDRMTPVFNAVSFYNLNIACIHIDFWSCHLCTEISPGSLNRWMTSGTVDAEIVKVFAILHWGTSFWFLIFLQIGEPLPIFYFWETLPL